MCSSGGAATVTMDSGSPRGSGDALHGLKFGHKIYFEDSGGGGNGSSSKPPPSPEKGVAAPLPAPARKAKGVAPGGQPPPPPRCQVEGCNAELTGAKPYYCRHKVCCMHSKAPKVVVAGLEQRFCQQCSRFHQLPEFDQGKRSCRRRLAGHNERRRKPSLGPFAARHDHLASSFHEEPSRFRSFMMDFSFPNFTNRGRYFWSTSRAGDQVAAGEWQGSLDAPPLTAAASTALHGAQPYFRGSLTGTFRAPIEFPPVESLTRVSDSSCALSLLSTHAWSGSSAGDHAPVAPASRSFDGPPITHSGIGRDYATSSWGFGAQGSQTSSFDIQHHEATETSGAHFSGQLEFSTHDNEACVDHNSGGAYDHDDPSMHWSL